MNKKFKKIMSLLIIGSALTGLIASSYNYSFDNIEIGYDTGSSTDLEVVGRYASTSPKLYLVSSSYDILDIYDTNSNNFVNSYETENYDLLNVNRTETFRLLLLSNLTRGKKIKFSINYVPFFYPEDHLGENSNIPISLRYTRSPDFTWFNRYGNYNSISYYLNNTNVKLSKERFKVKIPAGSFVEKEVLEFYFQWSTGDASAVAQRYSGQTMNSLVLIDISSD